MTLPSYWARHFIKALTSGASGPVVFGCEDESGNTVGEFVVKFRSTVNGGPTGLFYEVLASLLAQQLDVRMPDAALVIMDAETILAAQSDSLRSRIRESLGVNFGTRFLTGGFATWTTGQSVPAGLEAVAQRIFAFDALIDNADRLISNPNLLSNGSTICAIDHEKAFAFVMLLGGGGEPFASNTLAFLRKHPLKAALKSTQLRLDEFVECLGGLDDDYINQLVEYARSVFSCDHGEKIVSHLRKARDSATRLPIALAEVLR